VLPIAGRGGDEPLARSVADELATSLMRAGMTVSNRPEMAHYHLSATLHRAGGDIGLTSRLIDVATGRLVWAHRHVGTSEELFSFEDVAAASVAAAIEPGLRAAEIDRAWRKPNRDLTANDLTLRALPLAFAHEADANSRALDLLGQAIERDPDHAFAVASSAWCIGQRAAYVFRLTNASVQERRRQFQQATTIARRALAMRGGASVLAILGNAFALIGDLETATAVIQKALSQIPGKPRLELESLWWTLEQPGNAREVCMRPLTISVMVLLVMAATFATEVGATTNSRHRHYGHPQHSYRGGEHQRFGSHHWWDQQRRRRR
jgi:tetratricopeptide (TPR) repeat protein